MLSLFATIPDPRRAEGKLYQLPHVLLFSIFAIVSGANSYRCMRTCLKVHRQRLNKAFKIKWNRPPAHTAIRYILRWLSAADVEMVFREHAANLNVAGGAGARVIAFDGKTLEGSFDNFTPAGIYLVGWFDKGKWDSRDGRKRQPRGIWKRRVAA